MGSENYVNRYVEILTGTMTDAIIRNVSLQTTIKLNEEIINEKIEELKRLQNTIDTSINNNVGVIQENEKTINELKTELNNARTELNNTKNELTSTRNELTNARTEITNTKTELNNVRTEITNTKNELNNVRTELSQVEGIKHQVQHIETFRSELIKERDDHQKTRTHYEGLITNLNNTIATLQIPPKKKKIDVMKPNVTPNILSDLMEPGPLKILMEPEITKDGGTF